MNKQIVVSEEILYLRQLCDKIKVKCIAGYFKHATERDALIYENIIKISFKLLESVAGKKDETLFEPEDYGGNDSEQKYGWKRNRGLYRKSSNIGTGAEQWSEKEINWACERAYYHSWRLDGNKFVKYDVFDIMPKIPFILISDSRRCFWNGAKMRTLTGIYRRPVHIASKGNNLVFRL